MEWLPCGEKEKQEICDGLRAYNAPFLGQVQDLSLCVREEGAVVAGIVARLLVDCIYVELLWVAEPYRKQGLGRRLLEEAETRGRILGARRMELDTFSFQALDYYPRLGFRCFARVEPYSGPYSRSYFLKEWED
ncbi:GNAT family N-acetyltransferase [Pseudoflavonifractor sp. 524-17]|uniref:GNAT family N-acetyltransferase n=1 Tax=Pseudoflavonifractor sp. 524-17 TaxID=2304577 RepID=UPI00137AF4D1|nr:GNAT family N-acetyltransferase [Pseudoflavonifractor sp. 524-17]NCE65191.1 GNAT family N-acetyltransferase [Pseudoflavonifractor sp. 524-17]